MTGQADFTLRSGQTVVEPLLGIPRGQGVLAQRYQCRRLFFGTGRLFAGQRAKSKIGIDVELLGIGHPDSIAGPLSNGIAVRYELEIE